MKKLALLILDGWGIGKKHSADAIFQANTPYFDQLWKDYPHSTLTTFGEDVGLPDGQMGNSEVGHTNIGAGRIVYQELVRINRAIRNDELSKNPVLNSAISKAKKEDKAFHLIGLVSDGGVHSHLSHLEALIDILSNAGISKLYIHAFTDGRDTDPHSGLNFIKQIETNYKDKAKIVTVVGRYYAMDRDKRWERIKIAYDAMVNGIGTKSDNMFLQIESQYKDGISDEFMNPILEDSYKFPLKHTRIKDGDIVLNFNFRTDRPREITEVLTQLDLHEYNMHKLSLTYLSMTEYDANFERIHILFTSEKLTNTLGEIISKLGLKQLRIAETEKYPHVTYFFNGGREIPFENEKRIMIPSPKVATYDLQPEMSAFIIKDAVIAEIKQEHPEFICLNFANTDMVGHTGVFNAGKKAAETVDICLSEIVPVALSQQYEVIIIADHGNADYMVNEDGTPNTQHSMNPVPFIHINCKTKTELAKTGKLADIAPTILHIMELEIPKEMDGEILIKEI